MYEILGHLNSIMPSSQEALDDLVDKAAAGLHRMMEHKKSEWERQRIRTQVIEDGMTVINTGQIPCSSVSSVIVMTFGYVFWNGLIFFELFKLLFFTWD